MIIKKLAKNAALKSRLHGSTEDQMKAVHFSFPLTMKIITQVALEVQVQTSKLSRSLGRVSRNLNNVAWKRFTSAQMQNHAMR